MVNPNAGEAEMIYTHINRINLLKTKALLKANLHNMDDQLLV